MGQEIKLTITTLGGFCISSTNGELFGEQSGRSRKMCSLVEYIATHCSREVTQAELIDALWREDEIADPANTLKTLLHRARTALTPLGLPGKDIILSRQGGYEWNSALNASVDFEEFDKLSAQAQTVSDGERLPLLLRALELYRGDFLPKSSTDEWVIPLTAYYHSQYLRLVHEAAELLVRRDRLEDVIGLLGRAVVIDPYDEQLHMRLIAAYTASGNQQAAMQHYNQVTDMFMSQFGITPSSELTDMYREIVKTTKTSEVNLQLVRDELREPGKCGGGYYCEYGVFKDLYRLKARDAARSGQVVHIVMLTVMGARGQKLSQKKLNAAMERLQSVVNESLRRGDIYSRFTVSQFLLMLPSATLEGCEPVVRRICHNFAQSYDHMNILIHSSVIPVEPVEPVED